MKNLKYIIIAIVFLVAGFFLGQSYQVNQALKQSSDQLATEQSLSPITIVFKYAESEITEIQNVGIIKDQSVLDLTQKIAEENQLAFKTQDYGELGLLVTQIGDQLNGQQNKYWQYYVNGELANVGAQAFKLTGGERIEWVFGESEY